MSRSTSHRNPPAVDTESLVSGLRGLAFWGSVLLPIVYLPLLSTPLLVSGSLGEQELVAVAGLLALNVLCLLFGHEYSP